MAVSPKRDPIRANGAKAGQPSNGYKIIGSRPLRPDGVDKVTGRAVYGADVRLPGLLSGKILRSPHAHARIRSIDTSKAEALPGVKAVVTGKDFPGADDRIEDLGEGAVNLKYLSNNVMADDKVVYYGQAVAAVAATNIHIAEEAIGLIEVDYEVLKPVMTVDDALADGAPIVLEGMRTDEMGERGTEPSNLFSHFRFERGDLEEGYRQAEVIVERSFRTETVHQGYIEPHAGTAHYNNDGQLTIWATTQGTFAVRGQTAEILRIPVSNIKVIPTEIGGGFGGKINTYLPPVAALLSKKAGNVPVQLVMSRTEVLTSSGPTSGSNIRVKIGADASGKITAAEADLYYEGGGYPAGAPVGAGANVSFAPYAIDNLRVDGYNVVVNRPPAAAYRAPGGTNAAYAVEVVVNEVAEKLGIDPADFRINNGSKEGDRRPDNVPIPVNGNIACVEAIKASDHYNTPLTGKNQGRGIASGYWNNWGGKSSATAVLNADGTVSLNEASTDIGGSRASLAMQFAEAIGIPYEKVKPRVGDTDSVAYNDVTGGSRTTFGTGLAVIKLAKKMKKQMLARLADLWEVDAGAIDYTDGVFSAGDNELSFDAAAKEIYRGDPLMVSATVHSDEFGPGFSTQLADVEVDPETGKVTILRYTIAQDAGKAIHPSYVEGQMQGGVVQGIGWALNEEYIYNEDGILLNASLLDYRMPTSLDLPMIDTIIVEVPNPGHPYGVRGVGEVNIVPPAGAIANAIYDAIGVRMTQLPMSPARVLEAIWAKERAAEPVPGDD